MNELNGLQRQILDEIKEDIKKNSDMSIKDFAKRHYISPAFLVNLSKKLGYSGYRELIFSFKSSHKSQPAAQDRDLAGIRNTIISNYSEEMVDTFVRHMKGAKEKYVYAMGIGYSMVAIDYISRKGVRDGYRLIYTESLGELSEFEDNVGIMVSESGETQLVIDEAEKCRQHGYFTIAFLRNENSRLRKMVDLPIIIPKEEWEDELQINTFVSNTIIAFQLLFSQL